MAAHLRNISRSDQPLYTELLQGFTIRLVELEEGEPDEAISIRLLIAELDYAPQFEALSYVWGDPTNRVPITCNGRPLDITVNLFSALKRARYDDRPRILWIDAICINQRNNTECSYHVSFMNKIYEKAKKVLVFMGIDEDGRAEDAKQLVKEHVERMKEYESTRVMPVLGSSDPILLDDRWKSLATLFSSSWFERAWVLQEVGVAKLPIVLYGKVDFKYRDLMNLARWITRCAQSLQAKANIKIFTVHTDWELWDSNWREISEFPEYELIDFLNHTKFLSCRRYHDHVYAYLGHPLFQKPGEDLPSIEPDYSLSPEQIDIDLTKLLLEQSGLRVLSTVEHDHASIRSESQASWTRTVGGVELVQNAFGVYAGFYFRAAGTKHPDPPCVVEGSRLSVKGIILGSVNKVHQFTVTSEDLEKPDDLKVLKVQHHEEAILDRIWADVHDNSDIKCHYPAQERTEILGLTLCSGLTNYNRAQSDMTKHSANFAMYWSLRLQATGKIGPESLQILSPTDGNADSYWFDMSLACEGRSFIITEQGYYGLGPWITQPGDICCILLGANVPFVLRKMDDSTYKLVGECYVHGVMDGEIMKDANVRVTDLVLC
jgi:hypothetical protein